MILKIAYDISKDEQNYKYCLIDKAYPIYKRKQIKILPAFSLHLLSNIDSASSTDGKYKIIRSYLVNKYHNQPLMDIAADSLLKSWSFIEDVYINRALNYFQIVNYKIKPITCYITTLEMCPYNRQERYFFVPFYTNIANQTHIIMHELMHLIFLDNYKKTLLETGLSEQGILDINEALTILLNLEFKDLMLVVEENNKPSTLDLQNVIKDEYKKHTPFDEILKKLMAMRANSIRI